MTYVMTSAQEANPSPTSRESSWETGYLQYGNFVFPPGTTTSLRVYPVYGPGGVLVQRQAIELQVKFVVTEDTWVYGYDRDGGLGTSRVATAGTASLDNAAQAISKTLSLPRQPLLFYNKGYGRYVILPPNAAQDDGLVTVPELFGVRPVQNIELSNGPRPSEQGVTWTTLTPKVLVGTWSVTAHIDSRGNEVDRDAQDVGPIAYEISDAQQDDQWTRTITGVFAAHSFPKELGPGTTRPMRAKEYLAATFPQPDQIQRTYGEFRETADKQFLEFTIIDRWVPSPQGFEPFLINADINYEVESDLNKGFFTWDCSLTGRVSVSHHAPKHWGYLAVLRILEDLVRQERRTAPWVYTEVETNDVLSTGEDGPIYRKIIQKRRAEDDFAQTLLQSMRIAENRHNRKVEVDITWKLLRSIPSTVLNHSGILLRARTGATWGSWVLSVASREFPTFSGRNNRVADAAPTGPFDSTSPEPEDLADSSNALTQRPLNQDGSFNRDLFRYPDTPTVEDGAGDTLLSSPYADIIDLDPGAPDERDTLNNTETEDNDSTNEGPPTATAGETLRDVIRFRHELTVVENTRTRTTQGLDTSVSDTPEQPSVASGGVLTSLPKSPTTTGSGLQTVPNFDPSFKTITRTLGPATHTLVSRGRCLRYDAPPARPVLFQVTPDGGNPTQLIPIRKPFFVERSTKQYDVSGRVRTLYFLSWHIRYQIPKDFVLDSNQTAEVTLRTNYPITQDG